MRTPIPTYFEPKGTLHYNVRTKSGELLNRMTACQLETLPASVVDWIYVPEQGRHCTLEEILALCASKTRSRKEA